MNCNGSSSASQIYRSRIKPSLQYLLRGVVPSLYDNERASHIIILHIFALVRNFFADANDVCDVSLLHLANVVGKIRLTEHP